MENKNVVSNWILLVSLGMRLKKYLYLTRDFESISTIKLKEKE